MSFELFVALRYLKAKRKGMFAVVTTSIGVAGVTVGVAALITTMSVMNGFQTDIQKKIVGAQAHISIYGTTSPADSAQLTAMVKEDPEVAATAPFVLGQAILTHRNRSIGLVLKGLDPAQEFAVNDLARKLVNGTWDGVGGEGKTPGIVLGVELADRMDVEVGSEVVLVSPQSVSTPLGLLPKMQRFKVTGLLKTGYYEYDNGTAWTGLDAASKFLGNEMSAAGIGVRLKNLNRADAVARPALGAGLPPRGAHLRPEQRDAVRGAEAREDGDVHHPDLDHFGGLAQHREHADPAHRREDARHRPAQGHGRARGHDPQDFSGRRRADRSSGVGAGMALGFLLSWIIATFKIVELPPDIYYLSRVPVDVRPWDVAAVTIMGLTLTILATIYPARRAAKSDPVEAIHYG